MNVCVRECVWLYFSIRNTGHESLHENTNTFDQKVCTDIFSQYKGIFDALVCMWEKVGTAVMRGGKVRQIKILPFKEKVTCAELQTK